MVDTRTGAFVNRDLAEYLVPVHADIPEIDAVLLDGFDDKANVLGAKGVGELGICGANAAVANAVFNATGVRVRDFPITIEKLLPGLPLLGGLSRRAVPRAVRAIPGRLGGVQGRRRSCQDPSSA